MASNSTTRSSYLVNKSRDVHAERKQYWYLDALSQR